MTKLAKFEVDLPIVAKPAKAQLLERDVTMANMWDRVYALAIGMIILHLGKHTGYISFLAWRGSWAFQNLTWYQHVDKM